VNCALEGDQLRPVDLDITGHRPRRACAPTLSTVSALAISIFFGSQPRSAQVPPNGRKSMIATVQTGRARPDRGHHRRCAGSNRSRGRISLVLTFLQRLRPGAGLIKTHASPSGRPHQSWNSSESGIRRPSFVNVRGKHREHALGAKGSGR